ncbi:MAG: long-chain acyl-[acyl-carrier-protein] reductase, partial [Trichodesmium sp. St7_bin2_1]|nr:long-chain acyl-[acyl-carrier-protein] reductase [Trichodesmium sp. St7_bin2_1]
AYIVCQQVEQGAQKLGIDLSKATVAVCGATGDIGSAVCRWLNTRTKVEELLLIARKQERLNALQKELKRGRILELNAALPLADIIVWVASIPEAVEIDPNVLKKPCLLIDGGYPKNMATKVQQEGIYVLNGGIVEHSLDIDWKIMKIVNMEVPGRQLFACFAESMLLEFEKLYTNFSWGRNLITVEKMELIGKLSVKHGFKPLML